MVAGWNRFQNVIRPRIAERAGGRYDSTQTPTGDPGASQSQSEGSGEDAVTDQARGIVWADATGRTRLTIVKSVGSSSAIEVALQGASQAGVLYDWASAMGVAIGTAAAAQYQAANQTAQLLFTTAAGSLIYLTLPAPQIGIFLADGKTIDATTIPALIAACIGTLSDGAGNVATAFIAGNLTASKNDLTPIG